MKNKKPHFTKPFLEVWKRVNAIVAEDGGVSDRAKLAFRDGMLKIGHIERVRNLYRVRDKLTSAALFFQPNAPQEAYLAGRKGRDLILKTRQVGFTTMSGVRGLDLALWEQNKSCGIMAHQQNFVTTIFEDIVKFSYEHFLADWGHLYKPVEKSDSKTALMFESDGLGRRLDSSMRVMFDFRGKTPNFLHVSEAAFITEPKRLTGSLNSVPVNGEVILESTPNGMGGFFYDQWQHWKNMGTLAPYKGFFVPWWQFYPEEPHNWTLPEGTILNPYERDLIDKGLTEAHIAWRRWCIVANCNNDPDVFENEYPTNDIDCFISGEAMVFPAGLIKSQQKNTRPPSKQGFLLSEGNGRIELAENSKGLVAIWEEPDVQKTYVIGADPAGGVGKDWAAAYVKCRESGKYVARIHAQIEPSDFATELYKLALYFNKAWICVEANNHGGTVIYALKQKFYKNLYKRREWDSITNKPASKVGFLTTRDSKMQVTERLKDALKKGKATLLDPDLIQELTTFLQIASKTGASVKREAAPGSHDDLVMAACFTEEMDASRGTISNDEENSLQDVDYLVDSETGFAIG
jgi:hypothetical protein